MINFLDTIFSKFRSCFTRNITFGWFVVIVMGLMVRTDNLGVTSIIRSLALAPIYDPLIGFFRSSAWVLETLEIRWQHVVKAYAPLVKVDNAVVMVGDGVKTGKEGNFMVGVKKLHQESGDSSKGEYIYGHMFGGIGVIACKGAKKFCVPLALRLQDGVKTILKWKDPLVRQGSHVEEMITLACGAASTFGKVILLLDRLFLTVPALLKLLECRANGSEVNIVTKAKSNCTAFKEPPAKKPGQRGAPRKIGKKVKLFGLFDSETEQFTDSVVKLYGKDEPVRWYCVDLLWGKKLYMKLRFVLAECCGYRTILVSTDLSMSPLSIIGLYGMRFGIESMFREFNQVICGFGYHFWTKKWPKLNRWAKKGASDPLDTVTDKKSRERILLALKATEGFAFVSIVAQGLLQLLSLSFSNTEEMANLRYLRTRRQSVVSEATTADFLRKNLFALLLNNTNSRISQLILSKQKRKISKIDNQRAS